MSSSPSPSPSPSHDDAAAGSSTASSPADGAGLIGDAGPVFDPGAAPPPAPELPAALAGGELWTVPRVKALMTAQGSLLHGAIAVDKQSSEWAYTEADLGAIAPALTRILNRYEPTRAAAAAGDELIVAVGFAGYAARSVSERRRALALARVDDDQAADDAADVGLSDDDAAAAAGVAELAAGAGEFPAPDEPPPITSPRRH
jgi:hypothetical protein